MMVQYATGRALPECDCQERKEKVITIISLTEMKKISYSFCNCGQHSAKLFYDNKFPSKPLHASIVFDIWLLQLLHEQLIHGIGRIHTWSRGLQSCLEANSPEVVPDFYRSLLDAYYNWRAVSSECEKFVATTLAQTAPEHCWDAGAFENLCPACFNFSPDDRNGLQLSKGKVEYNIVFVSIDGDMQLTRFKDVTSHKTHFQEWEVLPSKLFVNIDRRFYGTSSQPDPSDEEQPIEAEVEEPDQCASQFKASRGWESSTSTKELASLKSFDETGLMGMVTTVSLLSSLFTLNLYEDVFLEASTKTGLSFDLPVGRFHMLGHRLTKAQADLKASSGILERLYTQNNRKGTKFTEEYFDIQLGLQEVYYRENRNKAEPVDPNDAIFTAILNEEEILRDLEEDRRAGIPTRRKLPPPNQKLDRRDLEQVSKGHAVVRRTTQLLTQQHQTIDD
ncbi:hypothetical protein BGX38DRAFT_1302085 [Terfezia claveryi]|nr:hypothetical protein BGX38DRAFT_1302085 [Terfezia claveryi]